MKYTSDLAASLLGASAAVLAGCGGSDGDSDGRVPVAGTSTLVREDADSTHTQAGLRYVFFNVFGQPDGEFAAPDAGQAGWIEPTDQT